MRPAEPLITQDSSYYNYEPSKGARDYWLYPLCAGDFTYQPGYHLERASYDSWLLEVIAEGSAEIESEGRVFQAHSRDVVLLDCHKPHGYRSSSGWRALWAHFDGMPAKGYADMITRHGPVIDHPGTGEVKQYIQKLYEILADPSPEKEADMALLLTQALTVLCRPVEQEKPDERQAALNAIIAGLNQSPGREPSIADMARQASMSTLVPMIFVWRKTPGSSMDRSTWLSAAKLMTASGCSSSNRRLMPSRSQISSLQNRKLGYSITEARVERFPA